MMAGYLDSQPALWENHGVPDGPIEINPLFGFWSVVDRLNPSCTLAPFCPYYPTYNVVGLRVENFTASIATAGEFGWGCRDAETTPYCPDDSRRFGPEGSYTTFGAFMDYAAELQPIFLFIDQFNEFVSPDEGWNAETNDDLEPANLWGNDLDVVKQQIDMYRQRVGAP
jgi:hypothetical protein